MSTPQYPPILSFRYPDLQWSMSANDYNTLHVYNGAKPLQADLDALWPGVETQLGNITEINTKTLILQGQYDIQSQIIEAMRAINTGDKTTVQTILSIWDNT